MIDLEILIFYKLHNRRYNTVRVHVQSCIPIIVGLQNKLGNICWLNLEPLVAHSSCCEAVYCVDELVINFVYYS